MRILYQCTWRGCHTTMDVCSDMERHIRRRHLHLPDPVSEEDNEHEEEFYYTEIELPINLATPPPSSKPNPAKKKRHSGPASSAGATTSLLAAAALPILSDHMDMARPPHENPEYYKSASSSSSTVSRKPHVVSFPTARHVSTMPIAIPVANFAFSAARHQGSSSTVSENYYISGETERERERTNNKSDWNNCFFPRVLEVPKAMTAF